MTKSNSARLKRLESAAANMNKGAQELFDRVRQSNEPVTTHLFRMTWNELETLQHYFKISSDSFKQRHELVGLLVNPLYEKMVADIPQQERENLAVKYIAASDKTAFLHALTDYELEALNQVINPENDGIAWDEIPDIALEALEDGELTLDELRERYPAREESDHE